MKFGSHLKSVVKAFTWRLFAAADTFGLTFMMTGKLSAAVGVVGFEVLTKSVLYYGHERVWETGWLATMFHGVENV